MSRKYIVDARNYQINEVVQGVKFTRGRATVDANSIDPSFGLSVDETIKVFEGMGFVAEVVKDSETGLPVEVYPREDTKPEQPKERQPRKSRQQSKEDDGAVG